MDKLIADHHPILWCIRIIFCIIPAYFLPYTNLVQHQAGKVIHFLEKPNLVEQSKKSISGSSVTVNKTNVPPSMALPCFISWFDFLLFPLVLSPIWFERGNDALILLVVLTSYSNYRVLILNWFPWGINDSAMIHHHLMIKFLSLEKKEIMHMSSFCIRLNISISCPRSSTAGANVSLDRAIEWKKWKYPRGWLKNWIKAGAGTFHKMCPFCSLNFCFKMYSYRKNVVGGLYYST